MLRENTQPPAPDEILRRIEDIGPYMGYVALARDNFAPFKSKEAKNVIEGTLAELFPNDEWRQDGFEILPALQKNNGPFIEIGGPSPNGYRLVDLAEVHKATGKKIVVTNLSTEQLRQPVPESMRNALEIGGVADVRNLPYKEDSVGAFFSNALGFYSTPYLFRYSARVLEKNGLLVAGYMSGLEVADALRLGLELKAYSTHINQWSDGYESRIWQTVFQRTK